MSRMVDPVTVISAPTTSLEVWVTALLLVTVGALMTLSLHVRDNVKGAI
jgi:hypothetical protein